MKTIQLKATKNGTDYVSVNFIEYGKRVGGFNAAVKTVKRIAESGFMGEYGLTAVNNYIDQVGETQIIADMKARAERKAGDKFTL